MQNLGTASRRTVTIFLIVLGWCVAVLASTAPALAASSADRLELNWDGSGDRLRVTGSGYRAGDVVEVRLGSSPIQQARGDENGRIDISVPESLIASGMSGASIVLTGRSISGTSRILISAVPPRAAVLGPADVMPWVLGVAGVVVLSLSLWNRHRGQDRTATAPRGYRSRHCA